MTSSLAVLGEPATKSSRFASHITDTQRIFFCSGTKEQPLSKVLVSELARFEFFQPSTQFCRFLVVDIDHVFAVNYIYDLPVNIRPHAIVLTTKGVQAFWLIEGLPLTANAHQKPIRFAQDVGEMLRQACNGDPAVNPLTPSKCRNPLFEGAERFFLADCPPYALKSLCEPLRAFLATQQPSESTQILQSRSRAVWGELSAGQRNETIFQTIRRAAYRGEDFETLAYELNSQCQPPLPVAEVAGIVRSVQKFMETRFTPSETRNTSGEPVPDAVREFMAEIGRKGGSRKTEKQKAVLVKATNASRVVRSAQAVGRRAQIQSLKEAGYTQVQIAERLNINVKTVKRGWH
ncbi:primase C-terminal domain-containing protein [Rothia terrae]|uniref:Primase C-terminal domain-containing protein n=1 Tax=Rothia terrae TaxID=396015 RepID=A0A7S6WWH8_9MICC|nr:primase C-terminal domain-containing protein [Rothia terrae]QOW64813.1 primase C-terminal domain-containing protein [Rothia terrae]